MENHNDSDWLILDRHHIFPKSRFHSHKVIKLPRRLHEAWHDLMGDLTPQEALRFLHTLAKLFDRGGTLTMADIHRLRRQSKGG